MLWARTEPQEPGEITDINGDNNHYNYNKIIILTSVLLRWPSKLTASDFTRLGSIDSMV
jgi:hypothetical protein